MTAPTPSASSTPQPPAHRWLVLVAMTGALGMVMLDQTVVAVALPTMGRELPLSPTGQQWVLNAYVLAMAATVAVGGTLGEKFGGVRVFRVGVALFSLASAACGLAPEGDLGGPVLIAARVVQGFGAALMVPVSAVIVMNTFSTRERGRAMAAYVGISQLFLATGPLVGGLLTETISWRAVFWLNLPVGLLALILVRISRPANIARPDERIRPFSVLLLVAAIGATVVAVQQAGVWSWTSPLTLSLLVGGLALGVVFVLLQLRSRSPLIEVRLFAAPGFTPAVVVAGLVQFAMLGVVLFNSIYLQHLLDVPPLQAGLAVLPLIVPITVGAQIAGRWYDRSGVRPPAITGLLVATVGMAVWTVALPMLTYVGQVPGMVLTGLGIGLATSPTNTDALGRARPDQTNQASGLNQTMRQVGGTLGVACISAVVALAGSWQMSANSRQESADAIALGFATAAAVFAVAAFIGWRGLSRIRLTDASGSAATPAAVPPTPSQPPAR